MRTKSRLLGVGIAIAVALTPVVATALNATVGSLQQLPFSGPDAVSVNPTGIKMYYYVPDGTKALHALPASLPIVLGLHSCQADQGQVKDWLQSYADTYGFMLVIPFANRVDANVAGKTGCWDVGSDDALKNGKSDPAALYALVQYAGKTLLCSGHPCGDLEKVYATGQSSGAMMTNVLLGLYPDLFKAGASFMGVPFGCWAAGVGGAEPGPGTNDTLGKAAGWSGDCASGAVKHDAAGWAALLPAHTGTWPRMMIIHGEKDTLIDYTQNFSGQVAQWTTIHGLSTTPEATDYPMAPSGHTFTRTRYGGTGPEAMVEALSVKGTDHMSTPADVAAAQIVRFFGLGDETVPAAPTALASSAVTSSGATLTWTAPADTDLANYVVSQVNGTTSTPVAWPAASSAKLDLTGLSAGTTYTYAVAAVDKAGNVSTPPASQQLTTTGSAGSDSGGGGGCGQGVPSGAALLLAAAALLALRRRAVRA